MGLGALPLVGVVARKWARPWDDGDGGSASMEALQDKPACYGPPSAARPERSTSRPEFFLRQATDGRKDHAGTERVIFENFPNRIWRQ